MRYRDNRMGVNLCGHPAGIVMNGVELFDYTRLNHRPL